MSAPSLEWLESFREREYADRLPERPKRKLPGLYAIAMYWWRPDSPFLVCNAWPHCFCCQREVPSSGELTDKQRWNGASHYLDRAHLVDRAMGGLDGPQNLVPLCRMCHKGMPIFRGYDEYPGPIEWVERGGWMYDLIDFPGFPSLAPRIRPDSPERDLSRLWT